MKDYLIGEMSMNKKGMESEEEQRMFEFIYSEKQLKKCLRLVETQSLNENSEERMQSQKVLQEVTLETKDVLELATFLKQINNVNIQTTIRYSLAYLFNTTRVLTMNSAFLGYRLF